jgi:hypothetical protein
VVEACRRAAKDTSDDARDATFEDIRDVPRGRSCARSVIWSSLTSLRKG